MSIKFIEGRDSSEKIYCTNSTERICLSQIIKSFYSSYFISKSHFEEDGKKNYLVFQPMYRYFVRILGVGNGN